MLPDVLIRRPKVILTLLTALNLLNYLDRFVVSAVVAPIQDDLHLSNFVAGLLPTVFLIGYFATSPIFGALGDRLQFPGARPALIAMGVAVWSAATVASGLAQDGGSLVASRAVVGVGEASFATLAPALIDEIAPADGRARWMAIYSAATPIGSALGYLVGGAVAHAHGWRWAFFVAGGPGLVVALLCAFIVVPVSPRAVPERGLLAFARRLMSIPLYARTVLGYCAYTFAIGGFAYWAPKYLHAHYGIEAGLGAVDFGAITVVGGAGGTLLGGWAADRALARRHGARGAGDRGGAGQNWPPLPPSQVVDEPVADDLVVRVNLRICILGAAVGAPLAAMALASPTLGSFLASSLVCQVAVFSLNGPINVALLRSAPPELRASAMAVAIFAIHAFGDLWANPLIGWVADYAPMWEAMAAVPIVLAIAALVWWRAATAPGWLTAAARVR
jgi:MFS transporter, Spinster family, sphingosine-1-phosphate transporter